MSETRSATDTEGLLLRPLPRRQLPAPRLLRGPVGVAPSLAGMLALARRRGSRIVRVRRSAEGGSVTFGRDARARLSSCGIAVCVEALLDAARIAPGVPHALGSFAWGGERVGVEIYACHDGEKAMLRMGSPEPRGSAESPALQALRASLLASYLEGLGAVHAGALPPEDVLAIRLATETSDAAELLERQCDLALFALVARRRGGSTLAEALGKGLAAALSLGLVEEAVSALTECERVARSADPFILKAVAGVTAKAVSGAPAGLRSVLAASLR